jgi:hypothetical protein
MSADTGTGFRNVRPDGLNMTSRYVATRMDINPDYTARAKSMSKHEGARSMRIERGNRETTASTLTRKRPKGYGGGRCMRAVSLCKSSAVDETPKTRMRCSTLIGNDARDVGRPVRCRGSS